MSNLSSVIKSIQDIMRRDLPYTYKGETTAIPSVTGDQCPA